jgi:archaellum component FlaC
MSIWDDFKNGITTATGTVTKTVSGVIEKVDPQLIELKKDYSHLSTQYNALRNQVQAEVKSFEKVNELYKTYAGLSCGLLIVNSMVNMDDGKFNNFLKATTIPPPQMKASNYLPSDVAGFIKDKLGSASQNVINGIYNFDSLKKEGWFDHPIGVNVSSGQLSVLEGLSSALSIGGFSSFAPLGIVTSALGAMSSFSIVGGVGIVIANIVNDTNSYENANKKLHHGIDELNHDLQNIDNAVSELHQAIDKIKSSTIGLLKELNAIVPCNFSWQLKTSDYDASFFAALHSAYNEYGIIGRIKLKWSRFHSRNPHKNLADFKESVEYLLNPTYSIKQIEEFIDLVAKYTESMEAVH